MDPRANLNAANQFEACTLAELKKSSRWLNRFARDVYSQTGEDGILEKALSVLPCHSGWCVEFGAWDGKYLSNTFRLVEQKDYSVVLIEGNTKKYRALCAEYPFKERAIFKNCFVGWSKDDGLDRILEKEPIPLDFDLLSIDVDGNDYHIWKATEKYNPKLVLIEFNPTASNHSDFVQPPDANCNKSNSPAPLVRLGKEKGYELICATRINLLFVRRDYYELFGIPDNSLEVMREEEEVTSLFVGFDGSVFLEGPAGLQWHRGEKIKVNTPLPNFLTRYPPNYNLLQDFVYRVRYRLKLLFSKI
jgi:hypothetical protein